MEVRLEPDVAATVEELVAKGLHPTPTALVSQALRLLLDKPECHRRHEELKRLI
jgi:Arc/MetJ-type ribon-helix-helix transcriptional regulator